MLQLVSVSDGALGSSICGTLREVFLDGILHGNLSSDNEDTLSLYIALTVKIVTSVSSPLLVNSELDYSMILYWYVLYLCCRYNFLAEGYVVKVDHQIYCTVFCKCYCMADLYLYKHRLLCLLQLYSAGIISWLTEDSEDLDGSESSMRHRLMTLCQEPPHHLQIQALRLLQVSQSQS